MRDRRMAYMRLQLKSILSIITMMALLVACSSPSIDSDEESSSETRIYHSESGEIKVPAEPKRIAVLAATYAGNLLKLGITPIAVNEWPKKNKFYEGKLDKVEVVTEDSYEKLLSLKPDLIITYSDDKNIKKYQEIAPTVALTYTKYN